MSYRQKMGWRLRRERRPARPWRSRAQRGDAHRWRRRRPQRRRPVTRGRLHPPAAPAASPCPPRSMRLPSRCGRRSPAPDNALCRVKLPLCFGYIYLISCLFMRGALPIQESSHGSAFQVDALFLSLYRRQKPRCTRLMTLQLTFRLMNEGP